MKDSKALFQEVCGKVNSPRSQSDEKVNNGIAYICKIELRSYGVRP